ncbi:MAG TPA: cytochrome C oxidase subunit IV family protein [Longimicrobiales bacterium]|nr:cytochrome C oxidase subunit IV family protein [Longimicrobiales bacterium]
MAELATQEHEHEHDHPSVWTYVVIGVILTVVTAVEVAIFYIPALAGVIVPLLLGLSAAKFVLVVMFYMHLKMDSRIFSWVFLAPMALAVFLVVALVILFNLLPGMI